MDAVVQLKLKGLDASGELAPLVDDLEVQTVAVRGGHPWPEEAKKNHPGSAGNFSGTKLVEGQELHRVSPGKGLNRLPERTREKCREGKI
jgi:hypothetical protein